MNALTALVRKDLVLYFADRRALIMSIVAPIVIAAFFGYLFGGNDRKPAHIEVVVTDLDRSALSARIVAALHADTTFTVTDADEASAAALVKAGKVPVALVFPAGFGEQAGRALLGGGPKPEVVLRHDPSQPMALQVVRGLLAQHVMQSVMGSVAGPRDLSLPYATREEEAGAGPEKKYNSFSHAFVGMGVQFVLFMGVDIGIALLAMRRLGLWKRLRAAPLSRGTLLASRVLSCALIALFSLTVVFAVAVAFFGMRIDGSVVGFAGVLIAFALMTASFGLLIAALGKTPEATRGLAILVTLLMVMLGGAWVPAFIFPAWLQKATLAVPTRWAVDGLDAMSWRGLPVEAALPAIGVLLGFAAVFTALAIARFQWEE